MSVVLKFILCCYLISVTYAKTEEEVHSMFVSLAIECNKDFAITAEEMTELHAHRIPDTENAKCLLNCVFKKSDWMNDKGMFDLANADKFAEREHAGDEDYIARSKKLFDHCKTVNDASVSDGEKGCERAALLTKCLTENAPKMGFKMQM